MAAVIVRDVCIGEGGPLICVPVMGRDEDQIKEQAQTAAKSPADLIEFRVDAVEGLDRDKLISLLGLVRSETGRLPLIMTYRTSREGGLGHADEGEYLSLCRAGILSGRIDILDLELKVVLDLKDEGEDLICLAHREGVKVILSNHDFAATPPEDLMMGRLKEMDRMGADILKIAVMPASKDDVIRLLRVSARMSEICQKPLITMSMGRLGLISRLAGAFSGSAVTFASAGKASAPGHIDCTDMRRILDDLKRIEEK